MTPSTTTARPLLLALLVLGLGAAVVPAEDEPVVAVRTVAVKATEVAEPAPMPDELRPWASRLERLPGAHRFELLGHSVRSGAPGTSLAFALPADHEAEVVAAPRSDGRVDVRMVITRPGKEPGTREKVLTHAVVVDDGATYVVRLQDALGRDAHLLLLVTAGARS
ncbi:MAG: hypothetical protein M9894_34810 [Planctomycetes bacterium]|nr:hypothetical protein [Planctomycetota bacterium]